ncbi:MAG: hypothetical protein ACRDJU_08405 [Actinomycetota bacterium]
MGDRGDHLHKDDYPATLLLLAGLLGHRQDREELGFVPTDAGAWVDWEALVDGPLSSTEQAAVYIARGCAMPSATAACPRASRSSPPTS